MRKSLIYTIMTAFSLFVISSIQISAQEFWTGTKNTTGDISRTGFVGFGVASPVFSIDADSTIGINGSPVLYLPDQAVYANSLIIGNGGLNLSHTGGAEGQKNTFIGNGAGQANTTGYENLFLGFNAGLGTQGGYRNVFMGANAGRSNTSGYKNIFLGANAGYSATSGTENMCIGISAGRNVNGQHNIMLGSFSGYNVQNGNQNVTIGSYAGRGNNLHNKSGCVMLGYMAGYSEENSNRLYIENSNSTAPLIYGEFDNDVLRFNGKVGVATTSSPSATFHVNGTGIFEDTLYVDSKIYAEEVEVVPSVTWPDYVFESGYKLPSLTEVEEFIAENGHLPEIPKTEEVQANGIRVGEMNAKLLKKVEELTLYLIEQQKQIDALKKQNETLKKHLK